MNMHLLLCEAPADEIRRISSGEVTVPRCLTYTSHKPVKGGLFDERIFGNNHNGICLCGQYQKIAKTGVICQNCNVEVVGRRLFEDLPIGHIELALPVTIRVQTAVRCVGVISPAMRPVIKIGPAKVCSSDLNFFYNRIIERNNRLKRLLVMQQVETVNIDDIDEIIEYERCLLGRAVEALLYNERLDKPVVSESGRALYSLEKLLGDLSRALLKTEPPEWAIEIRNLAAYAAVNSIDDLLEWLNRTVKEYEEKNGITSWQERSDEANTTPGQDLIAQYRAAILIIQVLRPRRPRKTATKPPKLPAE